MAGYAESALNGQAMPQQRQFLLGKSVFFFIFMTGLSIRTGQAARIQRWVRALSQRIRPPTSGSFSYSSSAASQ